MALKGDLSTVGLSDLFQMITMSQKDGTLVVQDKESRKCIYFSNQGIQLLSTGKRKSFRLGEYLLRKGKLTTKQLDQALKVQKKTGKKLGEVLISEKIVSEEDVTVIVRAQIEEEIFDLFHWKHAAFEFIEGPAPSELVEADRSVMELTMDVQGLLLEAARRLDEWERIKDRIEGMDVPYEKTGDLPENVLGEWPGLQEVFKSPVSVRLVADALQISTYESSRLFAALVEQGSIHALSPSEVIQAVRGAIERGETDAGLGMVRAILGSIQDQPDILVACAEILTAQGASSEASPLYARAAELYEGGGQNDHAQSKYLMALEGAPNNIPARTSYFRFLLRGVQLDPARDQLTVLIAVLLEQNHAEEIIPLAEEFLAQAPDDVVVHLQLAEISIRMENYDRAQAEMTIVRKNLPEDPAKREAVLQRLAALGQPEAVAQLKAEKVKRKKRWVNYSTIAGGVLLVLFIGNRVYFEFSARSAYQEASSRSQALEHGGHLEEALQEIVQFEKGSYGSAFLTASQVGEEKDRLEKLIQQQKKAAGIDQTPVIVPTKNLNELAQRMDQAFLRGTLTVAGQLAHQLLQEATTSKQQDFIQKSQAILQKIEQYEKEARLLLAHARELEEEGKVRESVERIQDLEKRFPYSQTVRSATAPLRVATRPPRARLFQNNVDMGSTPVIIHLPLTGATELRLQKEGYAVLTTQVQMNQTGEIVLELLKNYVWRSTLAAPLEMNPAIGRGALYQTTRGHVYSCSLSERRILWDYPVSADIEAAPLMIKSMLVFGSNDATVTALEVEGDAPKLLWKIRAEDAVRTSPVYLPDTDMIVFSNRSGWITAVSSKGEPRWKVKMSSEVVRLAGGGGGIVVAACTDGTLCALKGPEDHDVVWKKKIPKAFSRGPILHENVLLLGCHDGTLFVLDAATGDPVWSVTMDASVTALSVSDEGVMYAGSNRGTLAAYPLDRRQPLWQIRLGSAARSDPVRVDGKILVGTDAGYLYCVEADSGSTNWKFKSEESIRSAPVVSQNMVYCGSQDRNLYVIDME